MKGSSFDIPLPPLGCRLQHSCVSRPKIPPVPADIRSDQRAGSNLGFVGSPCRVESTVSFRQDANGWTPES